MTASTSIASPSISAPLFFNVVYMMRWLIFAGVTLSFANGACSGRVDRGALRTPQTEVAYAETSAQRVVPPEEISHPKGSLTLPEARRYMLALINRDRATMDLPPLLLDEGAPSAAAQKHAEDMASHAFLGHWGSDGSVPEQRHTQEGGAHMVLENASCFTDEQARTLDHHARFDPTQIEQAESMYFNETPPHDGHRRNILSPYHTHVGVGLAQPVPTKTEIPVPCTVQEFTDHYGSYERLPKRAKVGDRVRVEANLGPLAKATAVGVARVDLPKKLAISELNTRRSYAVPSPYQMYWPRGLKTSIPVSIHGGRISIDVPLNFHNRAGLYEISIWVRAAGTSEYRMASLRTILVE